MIERFRNTIDRHPEVTAVVGATAVAVGLNFPAAVAHVEASRPNVVCTGHQEIPVADYPTTTAAGIFEATVDTSPTDRLKEDGTLQALSGAIATDPASIYPTDNARYYSIPRGAEVEQVTVDSAPKGVLHWPTDCTNLNP